MRADFVGFESAYAETSNRELLLNLARLDNHDPTYFFKVGQISTQYRMQAQLQGNANYTLQSSNVGVGAAAGGGTPLLDYEDNPQFTFIPVNDQTNAQFLIQPIAPETFYALYEQGWRVDQLFRLMVDRIELTVVKGNGSCEVSTFRNSPPMTGSKNYDQELSQYVVFLRVAAILYELQKNGHLILSGTSPFVPYDPNSALPEKTDGANGSGQAPAQKGAPGSAGTNTAGSPSPASPASSQPPSPPPPGPGDSNKSKTPTAEDMMNAMNKNAVWEWNGKQWLLGQKVPNAVFYLNVYGNQNDAAAQAEINQIEQDVLKAWPVLQDKASSTSPATNQLTGRLVHRVVQILQKGFSISPPQTETIGPCPTNTGGVSSRLVMRSMLGIMSAAAQEQKPFHDLRTSNPLVQPKALLAEDMTPDAMGDLRPFKDSVPQLEMVPLLHLTDIPENVPALIRITYKKQAYAIADDTIPGPDNVIENQYWDRDVFRLVSQLSAQVTVDISKFPLPTILQLNTQ